jgi:hypothetical protein
MEKAKTIENLPIYNNTTIGIFIYHSNVTVKENGNFSYNEEREPVCGWNAFLHPRIGCSY